SLHESSMKPQEVAPGLHAESRQSLICGQIHDAEHRTTVYARAVHMEIIVVASELLKRSR
ncbi:MAG TPA: hypothetical protein VE692_02060, partial [Nitrososphaera sp.]|nr:hypothetical protein [Nitrososphaera sp.]